MVALADRTTTRLRAARARAALGMPGLTVTTLVVGTLAVATIVLQADLHTPLQMPGHRGVLWLGALVAVALLARRAGATTATGLLASALLLGTGLAPGGVLGVLPYLLAALALDGLLAVPALRRRPLLLAALAAPVHLVALVVPLTRSIRVGVALPDVLPGMTSVAVWHLVFGLAAGLLGWLVYQGARRISGDDRPST